MTPEDGQFGLDPETVANMEREARFSELIDKLNREELGRAIAINDEGPTTASVRQSDAGADLQIHPSQTNETIIGYALPLKEDNTQHLIVFRTGDMIVTEVKSGTEGFDTTTYQRNFSPDVNALTNTRTFWPNPAAIIAQFSDPVNTYRSRITHRNNTAAALPEFEGYFETAFSLAKKAKAEREQTRAASMDRFLSVFEREFPPTDPHSPGPPAGPPQKPQG